ncbi:hypothetical protein ACOBQX_12245 [Actinokineospora sp. G85]|uniref:hypothetical protein n=1 Tax=Actinokineospora sp. G85 TaxID=3406626 RepID=UPI003C70AB0D
MKQLLAGALVLSALTACTAHPDATSSQAALDAQHSADRAAPSASAEPAADTPAKSPRGNLAKKVGEAAGVSAAQDDTSTVTFSIEKITVDPKDHLTSDALSPASQYKGVVMLESKSTSGPLVFRPAGTSGWEWAF